MALDKFTENVNVNQGQPDQPTLSAQQLKELLDSPGNLIKTYINEVLTEQIDTLISQLNNGKVDKIQGKGLSTNDFTTDLLNKLNGIEANANKYVLPKATDSELGGIKEGENVTISNGVLTITEYDVRNALGYTPATRDVVTDSENGLMSHFDKEFLDKIDDSISIDRNGNITTGGKITTEYGKNIKAGGKIEADGDVYTATGNIYTETGDVYSDIGNVKSNYGDIYCNNGNVFSKNGDIYTNNGSIKTDNGSFKSLNTYNNNIVTNEPNLYITSNGWIRRTTNTSSQRYKKDIKKLEDIELNPENLYELEVKQFKYKKDYQPNEQDARYDKQLIGFIAEDVEKVFPIAVDYEIDKDGNKVVENWNERYIIPAMLKLIQDQKKKIDELEQRVASLESEV